MDKKIKYLHVIHPGEYIMDELVARNISQIDLANTTGIRKTIINEIIKGKRDINAEYAVKLENALQIDAEFWMISQMNHDLSKIKNRLKRRGNGLKIK